MSRPLPFHLATWATVLAGAGGCADGALVVDQTRLAIRDPDGVVDQVDGVLQLLVLPGANHVCFPPAGVLDPPPPVDEPVTGFIRDTVLPLDGQAEVSVPPGELSILLRGRDAGGALVATGCEDVTLSPGETRTVGITIRRAVATGVCGNGTIEVGESCDDGDDPDRRLTAGDGCDALCQTEPFQPETTPAAAAGGREGAPAAAWPAEGPLIASWHVTSGTRNIRLRQFDARGETDGVSSGLLVARDLEARAGNQVDVALGARGDRFVAAWTDLAGEDGGDVRFQSLTVTSLRPEAPESQRATASGAQEQGAPTLALGEGGRALVVFEDEGSPTGLSGRLFGAADASPVGAMAFPVGTGTGNRAPALAATGSRWLLAYEPAAGGVRVDALEADGAARGAGFEVAASEAGGPGAPALAALPGGTAALLVWRDDRPGPAEGDSSIRARRLGADGQPLGEELVLDTTPGGDRTAPAVAAGGAGFAVAWVRDGSEIRGRFLDPEGRFLLSRDRFPTTDDFLVGVGVSVSAPTLALGGEGRVVFLWEEEEPDTTRIEGRVLPTP